MNASRFPVPDDVSLDPDDGSVDTKTVGIKKIMFGPASAARNSLRVV